MMVSIKLDADINMDMQGHYDKLILLRKAINAQIEVLEKDVMICTHKETTILGGFIFCENPNCGKMISAEDGSTQITRGAK